MPNDDVSTLAKILALLDGFWTPLLVLGAFAGLLGWRTGAWVMVAALCGAIASHLSIGAVAYRGVMRRPWPDVAPISDDDW